MSSLDVAYADAHRPRPPRADLSLNIELSNAAPQARWAILPLTLGSPPSRRVWSLDAFRLGELRRVTVVQATASCLLVRGAALPRCGADRAHRHVVHVVGATCRTR